MRWVHSSLAGGWQGSQQESEQGESGQSEPPPWIGAGGGCWCWVFLPCSFHKLVPNNAVTGQRLVGGPRLRHP